MRDREGILIIILLYLSHKLITSFFFLFLFFMGWPSESTEYNWSGAHGTIAYIWWDPPPQSRAHALVNGAGRYAYWPSYPYNNQLELWWQWSGCGRILGQLADSVRGSCSCVLQKDLISWTIITIILIIITAICMHVFTI